MLNCSRPIGGVNCLCQMTRRARRVGVGKHVSLCRRCALVRWHTGTLPGSQGYTHPTRLGRELKTRRSCQDCGRDADRVYG